MNNWFIKQADLKARKPKILEFLKGKGIPEEKASEMIDTFGKADPTKDTSAEYINWIIKMVLTNKMKEEDIDKVREYLEVFSKLKKSNKLKELKVNSDINSYKDVVDLYKIVKDYLGKPVTKQESERNTSYGLNKIYDKNGIKVYKITEPGVASYIAKDTNWCVKSYDTAKYYLSFGPLYLLETIGERYLISEGTDQFKNVEDIEVKEDFFNKMLPVLSELNIILRPNYLIRHNLDEKYYPGQREEIEKYAYINKALYDKEYEKAKVIIGQLKDENRIKSYKSILPNKMIYDGDIEGGIKLAKVFGSLDEQMIVNAHRNQVLNDKPLTYHIKPNKSLRLAKEDLLYFGKMIDSYAGTEIKDGEFLGLFGSRYPSKEEYLKVFDESIDNYINRSSRDKLEYFIKKHKEIITPEIMDKVVDYYIKNGFDFDYLIPYKPEYFTPEIMDKVVDYYIREGFELHYLIQRKPEYFTPEIMDKVVDCHIKKGFYFDYLIPYKPEYFTPEIMDKVVDYYIREGFELDSLIQHKPEYFTPEIMDKVVDYYIKNGFDFDYLIHYKPEYFTPEIMDKVVDYIREGFKLDSLIKYKHEYFTQENLENLILKNIFNTKYYNAFEGFVDIKKIISKFIKNNINNTDGIKKVLKLYSINKDIAREILKENNIYSEDFLDSLYKESLLNPKWFIVKTAEKVSYIDYAKFGTVKLIVDDFEIDLVPPRKEVYQDQESRNPTVSYGTLQDDALRRDFTINSMYLDLSSNRIIDPTGNGINDIKNKIIRTTDENPDKIFSEDPLRMLRAIRQAYSFGFSIPDYVKESIKRNAYRLSILTEERFRDEFVKILQLRNAKQAIKDLKELGLLNYFLPELEQTFGVSHDSPYHKETIEEHILDTVEKYGGNLADKLVALFHDIGKPAAKKLADGIAHFYDHEKISAELAEKIMRKLKFPSDLIKEVSNRIRLHMRPHQYSKDWNDKTIRKFIKDMGEYLDKVIEFAEIDTKSSQSEKTEENLRLLNEFKDRINKLKNDVNKASQKLYNGNELMQLLNLKPGPDLKKVIEYLSELQLENPNITKDEALVRLKEFVGNGFIPK